MFQLCGCYYYIALRKNKQKHYLPQVKNEACTTILSTVSRTSLNQTFSNPSSENIDECVYTFPLYEGVSVVAFTCRIGSRILRGVVKEKSKAKESYDKAVARGETAGLLEQLPEASDVFSTKLGNIPAGETVYVELTYVGELKHDAEANGIRFTLPMAIAPRYGPQPRGTIGRDSVGAQESGGMEITVDVNMPEGSFIQGIQSPSHPIAVTLGKTSSSKDSAPVMYRASATLSSASTELDKDFVLILQVTENSAPKALLEVHPSIPNQRALMVTLVPKFSLQPSYPEIVFVVDRSGSMADKIPTLISALQVFLKSLPVGVKFNICSFGSSHSFLWPRSVAYSQNSLEEATEHVRNFSANFGGTETFGALAASITNRFADLPCELILLTDGEIWNQAELFLYLNKEVKESKFGIRVFTLGIGDSISHALVEGIARAGNGFAQTVGEDEKFDKKVVRMLKGALSPHLRDCELELKYEYSRDSEDDFELVEKVTDSLRVLGTDDNTKPGREVVQKPISFYEESPGSDATETSPSAQNADADPYAHLPAICTPKLLQTPSTIPSLFPFSRTVIYMLLSEKTIQQTPKAVVLRASSSQGPLELIIPVEKIAEPGETVHQLAARKAIQELEEGRGWIFDSKDETGGFLREKFRGRFEEIVEREAVRLGTQFQVSGKWLAFVAVADNNFEMSDQDQVMAGIDSDSDSGKGSKPSTSISSRSRGSNPVAEFASSYSIPTPKSFGSSKKSSADVRYASFGASSPDQTATQTSQLQQYRRQSRSGQVPRYQQMSQMAVRGQAPDSNDFGSTRGFAAPSNSPVFGQPLRELGAMGGSFTLPGGSPPPTRGDSSFGGGVRGGSSFGGGVRGGSSFGRGGRGGSSFGGGRGAPGYGGGGALFGSSRGGEASFSSTNSQKRKASSAADESGTPSSLSPSDKVHSLIALQTFAGSWEASDELTEILGLPRKKLELWIGAGQQGGTNPEEGAWVTLLVIKFLEIFMQAEKEVWELVVEKAKGWLLGNGKSLVDDKMGNDAERILKEK